ncbi:uncharacterized protein [Setaria viridis]|uniref:Uncharacterized protein n=1 Tax=Setaria viridis TaxID=4556 RepID=A0A4U6V4E3_SETVI|nr:uncharacterized protein LOC117848326 [Setaria viridis]XP_034585572.1 uncharacterized protein LOC117848326 [Setaria viridis]XP_034585573.1 uncharacterized protein LOC117848326 [Setaria viridis]TKW23938.1 hypothetical protein SEVIR_3G020100v2 [Setaria viridis]
MLAQVSPEVKADGRRPDLTKKPEFPTPTFRSHRFGCVALKRSTRGGNCSATKRPQPHRKIKLANGRGEERSVRKRGRQRESVPGTRLTRRAHAATSPLPSLGFPFPETHPCRGQKPPVTSPIPASPFTPSSPVPFHTPPTQPLRRTYILPSALSSPRQPANLIPSNAAENPQALAAAQMFLTDKYSSLLPPHHHHSDAAPPKASNRRRQQRQLLTGKAACFDAALAARLRALLPLPGPASSSSPLAALARLADLLALTLAEAAQALAGEGDAAAVAAHLDAGVALLDACNAITARLERLRRRRLLARFALHLVASSSTGRARVALADRDDRSSASPPPPLPSLPFDQPRGRLSAAARVLVAVNAVSSLASAAAAAVLGGDALATVFPRVSGGDFPWAEPFNAVSIQLSALAVSNASEVDAIDEAVQRLASVLDGKGGGDEAALRAAAREVEERTEELTARLDRLSDAVNGVFRAALGLRNAELGAFMAGPAGKTCV